jgi:hypothetical protein
MTASVIGAFSPRNRTADPGTCTYSTREFSRTMRNEHGSDAGLRGWTVVSPSPKKENIMLSTKNKVGLVLAGLLGLVDLPSFLQKTPEGEVGPPYGILVLGSICGLITVIAVVVGWVKANRGAIRVAAGARVVSMLTALPAFFVDVPAGIKILVTAAVILTVVSVVLMLSPARQTTPVTD